MGQPVNVRWVASLGAGVLLLGSAVALEAQRGGSGRTADGTTIAGLPASGLDRQGLEQLLSASARQGPRTIWIVAGTKSLRVVRADVGVTVDVLATAERALADSGSGRSVGPFRQRPGEAVEPVFRTDAIRLARTTSRVTRLLTVAPSNGSISYSGDTLIAKAPVAGQRADADVVKQALQEHAQRLRPDATLRLPVLSIPARVPKQDFERAATQARSTLAQPLRLLAGDRRTQISPRQLGPHLALQTVGAQPSLVLRGSALQELAVPAAAELSRQVRQPRLTAPVPKAVLSTQGDVRWDPRPAEVTVIAPGAAGQTVTPRAVLSALGEHLRQQARPRQAPLTVPATVTAPPAVVPGQLNAVLGTFTTRFACCQGRVTNIKRIAQVVDGTVIGPGQSFSLNGIAGRRTRAKGYVDAPFILDGELSSDVGGGVSQVATTAYNAAFFAGMRLDEHQAHSFYISRYPAGREATVNFPGIDLRWTNNTASPVLVRAATTDTSVTVALYGRDDGRRVEALTGRRRALTGGDFAITVTRVLTRPGQPPVRERSSTTYNDPPTD